jgi:DNA repair protein RadC
MPKIKEIPKEERPIEKMLTSGASSLSNVELLAILLNTGTKDLSAKELAENLLVSINGMTSLKDTTLQNLLQIKGIGNKKACTLLAAIELSKRLEKKLDYKEKITSASKLAAYFKNELKEEYQEYFYCVYLDTTKKIIEKRLLFKGTLNYSTVHPREVFKYAYLNNAASMILVHNHPSGEVEPSKQDIALTKEIEDLAKIHGIVLDDHIIIGKDKYYSFFEGQEFAYET